MNLKCEGGTGGTVGTGYPSPFNLPCAYWHSVFFETTRDSKITKIYRGVANRCHHCHHCHHGSCAQGIIEVDPVGGTTGAGLLGRVLINAGIGRMSE